MAEDPSRDPLLYHHHCHLGLVGLTWGERERGEGCGEGEGLAPPTKHLSETGAHLRHFILGHSVHHPIANPIPVDNDAVWEEAIHLGSEGNIEHYITIHHVISIASHVTSTVCHVTSWYFCSAALKQSFKPSTISCWGPWMATLEYHLVRYLWKRCGQHG